MHECTISVAQAWLRRGDYQEFDRLHQQLMAEMLSDNFCAVGFLMTLWGNKPQ
jgi:hypothetical protein